MRFSVLAFRVLIRLSLRDDKRLASLQVFFIPLAIISRGGGIMTAATDKKRDGDVSSVAYLLCLSSTIPVLEHPIRTDASRFERDEGAA
jgi:hypothetical protein